MNLAVWALVAWLAIAAGLIALTIPQLRRAPKHSLRRALWLTAVITWSFAPAIGFSWDISFPASPALVLMFIQWARGGVVDSYSISLVAIAVVAVASATLAILYLPSRINQLVARRGS